MLNVLLQIHIAEEETKFGLDKEELNSIISEFENLKMDNVRIVGLMGMASFTENKEQVRKEFHHLKTVFEKYAQLQTTNYKPASPAGRLQTLSMGMSNDYKIAMEEGSNLVRIGSIIFGKRSRS